MHFIPCQSIFADWEISRFFIEVEGKMYSEKFPYPMSIWQWQILIENDPMCVLQQSTKMIIVEN
jgi:hypothetical protein